jgi:hypothetical protein
MAVVIITFRFSSARLARQVKARAVALCVSIRALELPSLSDDRGRARISVAKP